MSTLYQPMGMVVDVLQSTGTARIHARSRSSMKLNSSSFRVSYCSDIPGSKDISKIRHGLSVEIPYARCLSAIENIREQRSTKARTVVDTCKTRAKIDKLVSSLADSGRNITIKEQITAIRL